MKKRILIVEDNRHERDGLAMLLGGEGYFTDTVENGRFALEKLSCEEFDLVITDLMMPATDGLQFLHKLRSNGSSMPVVVITGNENMQNMLSAYQLGALDVLYKPFSFPELLDIIKRVVTD
jgi:DNA-binding NtrC family response regulator